MTFISDTPCPNKSCAAVERPKLIVSNGNKIPIVITKPFLH